MPWYKLLEINIKQKGINISLEALTSNGSQITKVDFAAFDWGLETLYLSPKMLEEPQGEVILKITTSYTHVMTGSYEITALVASDHVWESKKRTLELWKSRQLIAMPNTRGPTPVSDLLLQAQSLFQAGNRLLAMREEESFRGAIEKFSDAESIYVSLGDLHRQAQVLDHMAITSEELAEKGKGILVLAANGTARRNWDKAAQLYQQKGDAYGLAIALNRAAWLYSQVGEKLRALEYYNKAAPIFHAHASFANEGYALSEAGLLYQLLGEPNRAYQNFVSALSLHQRARNKAGEGETLNNIALYFLTEKEEPHKAIEYFNRALPLRANSPRAKAQTLNNQASAYSQLGDLSKALDLLKEALNLYKKAENSRGQALTLVNIGGLVGQLQKAQGKPDYEEQRKFYREAREVGVGLGFDTYIDASMAEIEIAAGNLNAARDHISKSIQSIERARKFVASHEAVSTYFASKISYYETYVRVLMKLAERYPKEGFAEAALEVSEATKARRLVELVSLPSKPKVLSAIKAQVPATGASVFADDDPVQFESLDSLIKQKELLQEQIKRASYQRDLHPSSEDTVLTPVSELLAKYQDYISQIKRTTLRKSDVSVRTLTAFEIQQLLDPDSLLIEYFLGEESSYVWVISNNEIVSKELPRRQEIEALAANFYGTLYNPPSLGSGIKGNSSSTKDLATYTSAATLLSNKVIAPIADRLVKKRLIIIGDGALNSVPFGALLIPDRASRATHVPLIVEHEIVTLPSASLLGLVRSKESPENVTPRSVAIFADPVFSSNDARVQLSPFRNKNKTAHDIFPRLEYTAQEGFAIESLDATAKLVTGFSASKSALENSDLRNYQILHFATHALLDNRHPELSKIVLSRVNERGEPQDGDLFALELFEQTLDAKLIVLSACQTAFGKDIRGEGFQSLTRAFMAAGAQAIVATLWSVSDNATSEFMQRFYYGMLVDKLTPSAALREAQISMWKASAWNHPFYWAAFTIQGDWVGWDSATQMPPNEDVITASFNDNLGPQFSRHFVQTSSNGLWIVAEYNPGDRGDHGVARLHNLNNGKTYDFDISKYLRTVEVTSVTAQVLFAPNAQWLAVLGAKGTTTLYSLADHVAETKNPVVLSAHQKEVNQAAFSPDGRWLITASEEEARAYLWDLRRKNSSQPILSIPLENRILNSSFSHNGRWLALCSADNLVLYDLTSDKVAENGKILSSVEGYGDRAQFSPDDRWLLISGYKKGIRLYDMRSSRSLDEPYILLNSDYELRARQFSPDSSWLTLTARYFGLNRDETEFKTLIFNLDHADKKPQTYEMLQNEVITVFSPNSNWLVSRTRNQDVISLWSITSKTVSPKPTTLSSGITLLGCNPSDFEFSHNSHWLAIKRCASSPVGSVEKSVYLWNLGSTKDIGKPLTINPTKGAHTIRFSHDNEWLAVGEDEGTVSLSKLSAGPSRMRTIVLGDQLTKIDGLEFTNDAKSLVTWNSEEQVKVWALDRIKTKWLTQKSK